MLLARKSEWRVGTPQTGRKWQGWQFIKKLSSQEGAGS